MSIPVVVSGCPGGRALEGGGVPMGPYCAKKEVCVSHMFFPWFQW